MGPGHRDFKCGTGGTFLQGATFCIDNHGGSVNISVDRTGNDAYEGTLAGIPTKQLNVRHAGSIGFSSQGPTSVMVLRVLLFVRG